MKQDISSAVIEQLLAEAERAHPNECCGILFGAGHRITRANATNNVHPTRRNHFEIDPRALIDAHRAERDGGPWIAGYYHSHPNSPPEPSATDTALAARDGKVWAIIGRADGDWEVRFWHDTPAGFKPLSYSAVDR